MGFQKLSRTFHQIGYIATLTISSDVYCIGDTDVGMDSVNIFVTCDGRTFRILVPSAYKYVEMISMEMKINLSDAVLKMEYDVGGNMASIPIENDILLLFYMELKRKDSQLTAYTHNVHVEHVFNMYFDETIDEFYKTRTPFAPELERPAACRLLLPPKIPTPSTSEFAASMQITDLPNEEEFNENYNLVSKAGEECITEGRIFRNKDVLKTSVALHAIRNIFQFNVYKF